MNDKELLEICDWPIQVRPGAHWPYEAYGIGLSLRRFALYPRSWPLSICAPHGINLNNTPSNDDINDAAPIAIYFSARKVAEFKRISTKRCYCVISPNVFYRRFNKVTQSPNAKGTIAFLAHTTHTLVDKMNFSEYAHQLLDLPAEFHPVTVCLHYNDVKKGVHRKFQKAGLNVTTAGHPLDDRFMKRFYEIIKSRQFSTSNGYGSYLFYCVEMNIPFFFYGNEPDFYERATNIRHNLNQCPKYKQVRQLFRGPTKIITREQKAFVEDELGVNNSLSRIRLASILYCSIIKRKFAQWCRR